MNEIVARAAADARAAAARIAAYVERTPLERSTGYSADFGAEVHFKLENRQTTGSFKLRGATNCLLTLTDARRAAGCVTASSGNHGVAVAYAMRELGIRGTIFVPEQTSDAKVDKIRSYGGTVEFFGKDGLDTEHHAREIAAQTGAFYLSPYNDAAVIAGQGSCGVEIVEQLPTVDVAFVAVGGGGLIGGVGSVLKAHNAAVHIVGCQPEASAIMARSVAAGEILDLPSEPTLSDGTAGGIEADAMTFPLVQAVVDEWVEVDEQEIAAAMQNYAASEGGVIEGAAAVALAGMRRCRDGVRGRRIVTVICGGNVSDSVLQRLDI